MLARENLGPAERIIQLLTTHQDHLYHNRPGCVGDDPSAPGGKAWKFVTHKHENGQFNVYELTKIGKKTTRTLLGSFRDPPVEVRKRDKDGKEFFALAFKPDSDRKVYGAPTPGRAFPNNVVGEYREPGLFPEVCAYVYRQIAEVYRLDNEFCARWASYAFTQDHMDMKTILAAFMLVQNRKGDPVLDAGKIAFHDEDYRDVGEAIALTYKKAGGLNAKQLVRIHDMLKLPQIAEINREMGFTTSRQPFLGRWPKVVEKYLANRETNTKLLTTAIKNGFRTHLIKLAKITGYRPQSPLFFKALRWKQAQASDGRRTMLNIDLDVATSWAGLSEEQICEAITKEKLGYKRIVALLPPELGLTRAIAVASIQAGALSDADMINLAPTWEDLGIVDLPIVADRLQKAIDKAKNTRAAHIAKNVRSEKLAEKLNEAADNAVKAAVIEVVKGLRVYFIVDISGSMEHAIETAKQHLAKIVQAFPPDKTHVSVFTTTGREVSIKVASAAGVENAFRGIKAGGGTLYSEGVRVLVGKYRPDPDEDALFIFVGDEEGEAASALANSIRGWGVVPVAFGLLKIGGRGNTVHGAATLLGIPCLGIDPKIFDDVYAIPRTLRNLIATAPIGAPVAGVAAKPRETLIDIIMKTDLLQKPAWA